MLVLALDLDLALVSHEQLEFLLQALLLLIGFCELALVQLDLKKNDKNTVWCCCNTVSLLENPHNRPPHSSPVRAKYGVSVVRLKSGAHSAAVIAVLYVIS